MPGPEAERVGTLRSVAAMYLAQRAIRAPKVHVTLRKAFGFGSSLMAMNPFDRQTLTLAFTGIIARRPAGSRGRRGFEGLAGRGGTHGRAAVGRMGSEPTTSATTA